MNVTPKSSTVTQLIHRKARATRLAHTFRFRARQIERYRDPFLQLVLFTALLGEDSRGASEGGGGGTARVRGLRLLPSSG